MDNETTKTVDTQEVTRKENKVTLGFRCNPNLKLQLATTAQNYGFTLSEYVESILTEFDLFQKENEKLKSKVNFYENDFLKSIFKKHKNTHLKFKNSKGEHQEMDIKNIQDIYTILINIVKV